MAKLEPLVNQEPKEQIVSPFSKKEIEQIAQEVVDSKETPSGGTKLYRHDTTIEINVSGDHYTARLKLVTNTPDSLVGEGVLDQDFISCMYCNPDNDYWSAVISVKYLGFCVYNPLYETTEEISISYTTEKYLTDTVTPL